MACNLTNGRTIPCSEQVGGIQAAYFINFNTASFNLDTDGMEIKSWPSGTIAYKFELKAANNSYTETVQKSADNGTLFFEQALTINLKKIDAQMTKNLKLLAAGRPKVLIHSRNGEAFLIGAKEGAELTAGSIQTGAAFGDAYGYSGLVFTGMEASPAFMVSGSTADSVFGDTTNRPTVIYS